MVQLIQRTDSGNLNHLRSRVISFAPGVLVSEHGLYSFIGFRFELLLKHPFNISVVHIRVISAHIKLSDIPFGSIFPVISSKEVTQPITGMICPFALLTGPIVINE